MFRSRAPDMRTIFQRWSNLSFIEHQKLLRCIQLFGSKKCSQLLRSCLCDSHNVIMPRHITTQIDAQQTDRRSQGNRVTGHKYIGLCSANFFRKNCGLGFCSVKFHLVTVTPRQNFLQVVVEMCYLLLSAEVCVGRRCSSIQSKRRDKRAVISKSVTEVNLQVKLIVLSRLVRTFTVKVCIAKPHNKVRI